MAEEKKEEVKTEDKPAWKKFISKWRVAITAAVGVVLGILAGEQGIVDGITEILKNFFGAQ